VQFIELKQQWQASESVKNFAEVEADDVCFIFIVYLKLGFSG